MGHWQCAACRMDAIDRRVEGVSVLDVGRCQGQNKQNMTQECLCLDEKQK